MPELAVYRQRAQIDNLIRGPLKIQNSVQLSQVAPNRDLFKHAMTFKQKCN